jgi:nitrogen regulatory protein PII
MSLLRPLASTFFFRQRTEAEHGYGSDDEADAVTRAIVQAAATGAVGDGNISVEPIDEALRIRTGERGPFAL